MDFFAESRLVTEEDFAAAAASSFSLASSIPEEIPVIASLRLAISESESFFSSSSSDSISSSVSSDELSIESMSSFSAC